MVGKLSDDTKMSGSRIPVLYCWNHGIPHPWSTPNDELRKSIAAKRGEWEDFDIGEPGIVGNLLEPALVENACEHLGLPEPELTPPVFKLDHFETSCDGLVQVEPAVTVRSAGIVRVHGDEITLAGPVPIECKVTTAPPTDEIPLYRGPIQLQAQMMATGASAGIIVTLHRGIERRIDVIPANPLIQAEIDMICLNFLDRVRNESWFPPVNVDDAVIPPAAQDKKTVEIDDRADDLAALERLRNERKTLDDDIAALEVRIMDALGDAQVGTAGPYTVEWPVRHYKEQPEKISPAKPARTIRLKTLKIRSMV